MLPAIHSLLRRFLLLGLLLRLLPAQAQLAPAAPHGYDFMLVTVYESPYKKEPHIQFVPAFQGQTILQLPPTDIYSTSTSELAKVEEGLTIANQHLSALTAAGWELAQANIVSSLAGRVMTRYLFRKAKS